MALSLIFPGQGSQHVGMASALAEREPTARHVLQEADEILGFPLSELMAEGPEEELTATRNAQPAILVHSVAVLRVLESRLGAVAFAAGHSLGELTAHVAAGTLSFGDALVTVRRRGELMFEAGQERPGAMAAVLGLLDAEVEKACARVETGVCVPANYNAAGQVVISGDVPGVEEGMERVREAGAKKVVPLAVSGAFHSPLMAPAAEGLATELERLTFRDPRFPVVANTTAEPIGSGSAARELLVRQITAPVRWSASITAMIEGGADRFLELGPGSVLCGLNRRNAPGKSCASIGAPDEIDSLEMPTA